MVGLSIQGFPNMNLPNQLARCWAIVSCYHHLSPLYRYSWTFILQEIFGRCDLYYILKLGVFKKSRRFGCFQKKMVVWIQPAMRLQWWWGLYMSDMFFCFSLGFGNMLARLTLIAIVQRLNCKSKIKKQSYHPARPRQDQKQHIWPTFPDL